MKTMPISIAANATIANAAQMAPRPTRFANHSSSRAGTAWSTRMNARATTNVNGGTARGDEPTS